MTEPTQPLQPPEAPTTDGSETASSGAHPLEIAPLVIASALAGVLLIWLALAADVVTLPAALLLSPLPWLGAGAIGLVAYGVRAAQHHRQA